MNLPSRIAMAASLPRRNPEKVAIQLPELLRGLEERFPGEWDEVLAPGEEDGGDWSGLLGRLDHAFDMAVAVQEGLWPDRLRFCLASVTAPGRAGKELDQTARERALRGLRHAGGAASWFALDLAGRSKAEQSLAEAVARLHGAVTADWTPARAAAVATYRIAGRQTSVAEKLGITQQAVSQMLLGARFRDLAAAEESLRAWLKGPDRPGLWPLGAGPQRSQSRLPVVPGLEE
ncbi:MAG: hypothetical protein EYC70_10570 [Planctomycetota bacterium]|nr:MAG: hypothetical protein EYC70_10570 [Planctomycetota bacterium]